MKKSTLLVLVLIGLCFAVGFATSCSCKNNITYESRMQFYADTSLVTRAMVHDTTWAKFEHAIDSIGPTDWVCDSCWQAIIEADYYKSIK